MSEREATSIMDTAGPNTQSVLDARYGGWRGTMTVSASL